MSIIIDLHALQTVPPSLINRDDTGAPKSAIFGGVPRQRVSSQSWKRAIRKYVEENFNAEDIGDRSRRLPEKIARLLEEQGIEHEEAVRRVELLFKQAKIQTAKDEVKAAEEDGDATEPVYPVTKYLLFLSQQQVSQVVAALIDSEGEKLTPAEAKKLLNTKQSVDIAMFGRMVADDASYNVDAAVQVAHAIGIHGSAPEFDYYTAVDDLVEDDEGTGAGMIGTTQFMSSTLYRYATVNVEGLAHNLGSDEAARDAALKFVEAFINSMPTGKINSFANQTVPELVYVTVRDSRPVSLVNAFETAVEADSQSDRRTVAAQRLAQEAKDVRDVYGFEPVGSYVLGLHGLGEIFAEVAEPVTLANLEEKIRVDLEGLQGDK